MSLYPEFVFHRRGRSTSWANARLIANVSPAALTDPDLLFARPECKIIKDQLKIKVGRLELQIDGRATGIYVKRYNAFSLRYRLASLVLRSGAVRSLRGAAILSRAGISTSRPLAAIELRSGGMLEASFFLTEEIHDGLTADAYWRNHLELVQGAEGLRYRRGFIKSLAELFSRLHRLGVYHNDLKDANILVTANATGSASFFLLDLEGVRRFRYLSRRRRVKNLVQINRTLGKFCSQREKLCFLNTYLAYNSEKKSAQIRWISDILRATKKADHKSSTKG